MRIGGALAHGDWINLLAEVGMKGFLSKTFQSLMSFLSKGKMDEDVVMIQHHFLITVFLGALYKFINDIRTHKCVATVNTAI